MKQLIRAQIFFDLGTANCRNCRFHQRGADQLWAAKERNWKQRFDSVHLISQLVLLILDRMPAATAHWQCAGRDPALVAGWPAKFWAFDGFRSVTVLPHARRRACGKF